MSDQCRESFEKWLNRDIPKGATWKVVYTENDDNWKLWQACWNTHAPCAVDLSELLDAIEAGDQAYQASGIHGQGWWRDCIEASIGKALPCLTIPRGGSVTEVPSVEELEDLISYYKSEKIIREGLEKLSSPVYVNTRDEALQIARETLAKADAECVRLGQKIESMK